VTCQDMFVKPCRGNGNTEHRAAVCHLFCVKLGDSATTTHGKLLQAFGVDASSTAQASRWHKLFSEGRNLVDDEQCYVRPSATRTRDKISRCFILRGPGGERILEVVPRGTEFGTQVKTDSRAGRTHTHTHTHTHSIIPK
jgi:hypothetical protein